MKFKLELILLLCLLLPGALAQSFWAAPADLSAEAAPAVDCPQAPTTPEDRRTDKHNLRVVAYNVEWLFAGGGDNSGRTPEEAKKHLEDVGDVVAKLRPDVLVMEEVQNCNMVQRLADYLHTKGLPGYKPYLLKGTDTGTMQNVALLTKVDPAVDLFRTKDRADYPIAGNLCNWKGAGGDYGVSKHFVTHIQVGSQRISLIAFHLLAFPVHNQRCAQREAQATVLRRLVDQELRKGHEVVVLGDLNDYSDKIADAADNEPRSRVMRILRQGVLSQSLSGNATLDAAARTTLVEVSQAIPQTERYTAVYDRNKISQIDHILLSPNLANKAHGARIFHDYPPFEVSDHWPVVIDIATSASATHGGQDQEIYW